MRTIIKRWGNSMALRIPKSVISKLDIREGTPLEITSKNGKIILEPQKKEVREGWAEAAREAHENEDDNLLMDFENNFDNKEWKW